jgi:hypothetical protein
MWGFLQIIQNKCLDIWQEGDDYDDANDWFMYVHISCQEITTALKFFNPSFTVCVLIKDVLAD